MRRKVIAPPNAANPKVRNYDMNFTKQSSTRILSAVCVAALFAAMPVQFDLGTSKGYINLHSSMAHAKRGGDDHDSDDRDNSGRSGDDDDDHRGHGSDDDDDDDDHRGRGRGGDDDDSHHSSGDDHWSGSNQSSNSSTIGGGNGGKGIRVVKFESTATSIEVVYSNGWKEEVENGRYERKNPAGRTVEQRRATQADVDRLVALR